MAARFAQPPLVAGGSTHVKSGGITEEEYQARYAYSFNMRLVWRWYRDRQDVLFLWAMDHTLNTRSEAAVHQAWRDVHTALIDQKDAGPDASVEQREVETNQLWATARRDLDPYMIPDLARIVLDYLT